jgi:hypothetical protein
MNIDRKPIAKVVNLVNAVSDYMTGADIVRADKESSARAYARAYQRVADLRERFQTVRTLSATINGHLDEFKNRRAG